MDRAHSELSISGLIVFIALVVRERYGVWMIQIQSNPGEYRFRTGIGVIP